MFKQEDQVSQRNRAIFRNIWQWCDGSAFYYSYEWVCEF